jgi:hypothetical protein
MTEATRSELISRRRAFSLLGVALPATILVVSQGAAQTPGMERREERREDREERREDRRDDREERRSRIINEPVTTGSTAPPTTGAGAVDAHQYHGGPKSDD